MSLNLSEKTAPKYSKEDIISIIKSTETNDEFQFFFNKISENIDNVYAFIQAFKEIMLLKSDDNNINSNINKILLVDGSLDFIFDHLLPMIEATNIDIKNEELISSRVEIIHILCDLMINFPTNINPYYKYHRALWKILLKIMKKCSHSIHYSTKAYNTQSHPLVLEAFRSSVNFFLKTKDQLSSKAQANRLISLCENNQQDTFLHSLTINFVMNFHSKDFGFVSLCKQIIGSGITNPRDLGFIHDILLSPNVKDPTDVYKYLFTIAVSHKTLANSSMYVVENTFDKFSHLTDFKPWCILFTKRCFEFIPFSLHKKGKDMSKSDQPKTKYCRKIYLIRRFFDKLFNLNVDWLSETIQKTAFSIINIDEDSISFLIKHYGIDFSNNSESVFNLNIEVDEKIKEDILSTNVEYLDMKRMLTDIKISLPMIHWTFTINDQGETVLQKKPSVSEVRRLFRNKSRIARRRPLAAYKKQNDESKEISKVFESLNDSLLKIENNAEKEIDFSLNNQSSIDESNLTEVV